MKFKLLFNNECKQHIYGFWTPEMFVNRNKSI